MPPFDAAIRVKLVGTYRIVRRVGGLVAVRERFNTGLRNILFALQ